MNRVTINGMMFQSIRKMVIRNDRVTLDGKEVDYGKPKNGILQVKVEGVLEELQADGSVTCDEVRGTVQAGGSVHCDNVGGDVQAGGSVHCDKIGGSVMAGGSISHG